MALHTWGMLKGLEIQPHELVLGLRCQVGAGTILPSG